MLTQAEIELEIQDTRDAFLMSFIKNRRRYYATQIRRCVEEGREPPDFMFSFFGGRR